MNALAPWPCLWKLEQQGRRRQVTLEMLCIDILPTSRSRSWHRNGRVTGGRRVREMCYRENGTARCIMKLPC